MNVSLTPELDAYVNEKVKSGLYHSASEVIRDGLRLLKRNDEMHDSRLADLRQRVDVGIGQLDTGQYVDYDSVDDLVGDIQRRSSRRR